MKIAPDLVKKLDIATAALSVVTAPLDRTPALVIDTCMSGNVGKLTKAAAVAAINGHSFGSETIGMPRRGFGPRPVTIMSPVSRTLYTALVDFLSKSLPVASRTNEAWTAHEDFGRGEDDATYIVDFDIASCYEYVEHETLQTELVLQSMEPAAVQALVDVLGELSGRNRGLPQLLSASDTLADVYLQGIERYLLRHGHRVSRYADDFRVIASTWAEANEIIELAAEVARSFGFVLSTEKTKVRKLERLAEGEERRDAFLKEKFKSAKKSMSFLDLVQVGYDEVELLQIEPEEEEATQEAFRTILEEWASDEPTVDDSLRLKLLKPALRTLAPASDRLSDNVIKQLAFRSPILVQQLCEYLLLRNGNKQLLSKAENPDNWASLETLTAMPRQSPWTKLWLLHSAEVLVTVGTQEEQNVRAWVTQQLSDRHEVVRAQAAWCSAVAGHLREKEVANLYRDATAVSRPALAASLGRAEFSKSHGLVSAIVGDGPLNNTAFDWGASQT